MPPLLPEDAPPEDWVVGLVAGVLAGLDCTGADGVTVCAEPWTGAGEYTGGAEPSLVVTAGL